MPIKILLLSNPNSPHTIKWARALSDRGFDIFIFGLSPFNKILYKNYKKIKIYSLGIKEKRIKGGDLSKLSYIRGLIKLKRIIQDFSPDILHAHYATSYGLLGALSGCHPFIISVWGKDVFDFPNKSILHKYLLKFNLKKADKILSTSRIMAKEVTKYTQKNIEVTPFGIDLEVFKPTKVNNVFTDDIVIGTIKTLELKYGIEYLINAFKIVRDKFRELPLKMLIVGGGSLEGYLKNIVKVLKIEADTLFTGPVSYDEVPKYHNILSIYVTVSISNSESFGVAVLESSSCEKPVIVTDVGGLPEVVEDGVTGFVVPVKNPEKTAEAMEKLILNKKLRMEMGKAGRKRVEKFYNFNDNLQQIVNIYNDILRN